MNPGKGKGGPGGAPGTDTLPPGTPGDPESPLILKGVLGNNPWASGKENGSLGVGRPNLEKIS